MYLRREKQDIVSALATTYELINSVVSLDYAVPPHFDEDEQNLRTLAVDDMVIDLKAVAEALETELTR